MITENMTDKELLSACKPLMQMEGWEALVALIQRRQGTFNTRMVSLVDPVEIYRAQGRILAYGDLIGLKEEAKAV